MSIFNVQSLTVVFKVWGRVFGDLANSNLYFFKWYKLDSFNYSWSMIEKERDVTFFQLQKSRMPEEAFLSFSLVCVKHPAGLCFAVNYDVIIVTLDFSFSLDLHPVWDSCLAPMLSDGASHFTWSWSQWGKTVTRCDPGWDELVWTIRQRLQYPGSLESCN